VTGDADATAVDEPASRTTAPLEGTLGIAFLGCGQAARMHSRTLRRLDGGLGLYHASRDPERARAFAAELGGAGSFGGYEEALRDDRVDVAVVVTPPSSHLEWTLAALDAGKHVIVEKPAFLRSGDFALVEERSRRAGRRVLVAENYFYKPLADALRALFRDGAVGEPIFLTVNALKHQRVEGWRGDAGLAGGGALFEGGIHWISLLAHLGPRVTSVRAWRARRGDGPERSMAVVLGYDRGGAATLVHSWEVPSPLGGLRLSRVYGSEGTATFESNGLFMMVLGRRRRLRFPGLRDLRGYRAMFRDFLRSLRSGEPPAYGLDRARRDVEIVEEAYRSAEGHRGGDPGARAALRGGPDHPG